MLTAASTVTRPNFLVDLVGRCFTKVFGHADFAEFSGEIARKIDDVREDVAQRIRAGAS
jgi:hypothetical protein